MFTSGDKSSSGSPLLPTTTTTTTRRRALDSVELAEEDGIVSNNINSGHNHHYTPQQQQNHHRSLVGNWCSVSRRKLNITLKFLRPAGKNLSRWILGAFMLLVVSTMFVKFMLMSSFLAVNAKTSSHILIRPVVTDPSEMSHNILMEHEQTPEIWRRPRSDNYYKCIDRSSAEMRNGSATNGHILVHANGGLNQMKTGVSIYAKKSFIMKLWAGCQISDMVAIAKIMNATLVLPSLDHKSFWTDSSDFKDIFDWRHFMEALKDDIQVAESLPPHLAAVKPLAKAPVSWSKAC
ncbi:unnamed protein product [Ilex paraguariensis]|uniref:O-fucosyltransferase family protein n=1 Tax=Ilex paraguariensis TaxID=185542 RepID=A0ABC8RBI2_9AQUA